jgi:hypothetical protein
LTRRGQLAARVSNSLREDWTEKHCADALKLSMWGGFYGSATRNPIPRRIIDRFVRRCTECGEPSKFDARRDDRYCLAPSTSR